jgi:hypothetical protein
LKNHKSNLSRFASISFPDRKTIVFLFLPW